MKNIFFAIFMAFSSSVCVGVEILNDLDVANQIAKEQEKNTLLIFSLENCKYCEILKNDLNNFENIDNYVICILDSRQNKKITGKMQIKKWPTSIVITTGKEQQGEVSRKIGYGDKKEYEIWLKENAKFFGKDDACGCDCADDCVCRKNGICTCCGNNCKCIK